MKIILSNSTTATCFLCLQPLHDVLCLIITSQSNVRKSRKRCTLDLRRIRTALYFNTARTIVSPLTPSLTAATALYFNFLAYQINLLQRIQNNLVRAVRRVPKREQYVSP